MSAVIFYVDFYVLDVLKEIRITGSMFWNHKSSPLHSHLIRYFRKHLLSVYYASSSRDSKANERTKEGMR